MSFVPLPCNQNQFPSPCFYYPSTSFSPHWEVGSVSAFDNSGYSSPCYPSISPVGFDNTQRERDPFVGFYNFVGDASAASGANNPEFVDAQGLGAGGCDHCSSISQAWKNGVVFGSAMARRWKDGKFDATSPRTDENRTPKYETNERKQRQQPKEEEKKEEKQNSKRLSQQPRPSQQPRLSQQPSSSQQPRPSQQQEKKSKEQGKDDEKRALRRLSKQQQLGVQGKAVGPKQTQRPANIRMEKEKRKSQKNPQEESEDLTEADDNKNKNRQSSSSHFRSEDDGRTCDTGDISSRAISSRDGSSRDEVRSRDVVSSSAWSGEDAWSCKSLEEDDWTRATWEAWFGANSSSSKS